MKLEQAGPPGQESTGAPTRTGARRRRWFALAAFCSPLVLLVAAEVVLRLAGYGYPTSFFLEAQQDDEKVFIENPKFGWRFFPQAVARAPLPLVLESPKPPQTVRIFLFGESAAMGDPEPAYGFGRQLQRLVQARHPAKRIELVNVAMTAINSHVIREIARDCAPRRGDLWLIYAGNNEVVGPFGAGTVFGRQAPGAAWVRAVLALKSFRLGQWLTSLLSQANNPQQWEGMEFFLRNQVPAADRRLGNVYGNFSQNLSSIVRAGQRAGAKVVLATVAVNLKDCPPFASVHRADLKPADLDKWNEAFERGRKLESQGRYPEALAAYQEAAQTDPSFAELIFRRATCELASSRMPEAKADFFLARDLDALRFRADSRINELIRKTAATRQAPLVDLETETALPPNGGLPGDDQFYDHVHFNFEGNYQVAKRLAAEVERQLFPASSPSGTMLPETEVARQLAFTDFDRRRVEEEMRERLRQPPFTAQSNFEERDRRWQTTLATSQPPPADSVWEYRGALAQAAGDWVLRENFGRLLEALNDKPAAAEQWGQVVSLLPFEPEGYFHLGNLALDAGSYGAAGSQFRQALQLRPNSTEALNGLGLALASQGQTNGALAQFRAALELNPNYSAARVNMALLLARSGDTARAISEYRTVLRTDTNEVAARINLAKLLSAQGKKDEAISLYTQALLLRPDDPIAQFDLANALAAENRHEEALPHYAAAVEYQPAFADAHYNLALELARAGRISQALPHFAEAVRLRPASAEMHFNYGVGLAKLQQYDQAAGQFEQTLKLQPGYPSAQAMLERARQLGLHSLGPVSQ